MLDDLAEAVDAACCADPASLSDCESVLALVRMQKRLAAQTARAAAACADAGEWRASGARSAASWLAWQGGLRRHDADRAIRLGRAVRHMPVVDEAWSAGDISDSHVSVLSAARNQTSDELFARDEKILVDDAQTMRFGPFVQAVDYWIERADPEGSAERDARRVKRRQLYSSTSFGGMVFGKYTLDPVNGAIFQNELRRLEQAMFEADWREAQRRCGDGATMFDLVRTAAQRRADALVEMATRSASAPEGSKRPEPLFSVLVGYETFAGAICQLADGTVVSPHSLLGWLDQAWVERVVFDSPSRVIDVGKRRRLFKDATRRAVQVRDQECFHITCDVPADQCQIDHIEPWAAGGLTITDNGRPACAFHNRQRNQDRGGRPPPHGP